MTKKSLRRIANKPQSIREWGRSKSFQMAIFVVINQEKQMIELKAEIEGFRQQNEHVLTVVI